jgi:hypothetical protein
MLTTQLHVVLRSRMVGLYLHSPHVLVLNRRDFTFFVIPHILSKWIVLRCFQYLVLNECRDIWYDTWLKPRKYCSSDNRRNDGSWCNWQVCVDARGELRVDLWLSRLCTGPRRRRICKPLSSCARSHCSDALCLRTANKWNKTCNFILASNGSEYEGLSLL